MRARFFSAMLDITLNQVLQHTAYVLEVEAIALRPEEIDGERRSEKS